MKTEIRLWLDDVRDPVKYGHIGWMWVKTYDEAIKAFQDYEVVEASLDHDLTIDQTIGVEDKEMTGYDVVCWMEEHGVFPTMGVTVHSANPVGSARMKQALVAMVRLKGRQMYLVRVNPALDISSNFTIRDDQ